MSPPFKVVAVSGGTFRPSRTLVLLQAIVAELALNLPIDSRIIELGDIVRRIGAERDQVGDTPKTERDAEERGHLALAIATAKVAATRTGLDLTSRLFEVTGARATHAALRLYLHWRNLRTQTLHAPLDDKLHEPGDWALNTAQPTPSFHS